MVDVSRGAMIPDLNELIAAVMRGATIHDAKRLHDGHDPEHGQRAAAFALELQGRYVQLDTPRLKQLHRAIHDHVDGRTSANPTIGTCWDADRLNLWRINFRPNERFLSTDAARAPDVIHRAADLAGQHRDWREIYARFALE